MRRGEVVGFLGPNGSGKTTTIRMICGLLRLDAGEGEVLGFDLRTGSREIKARLGYMTQRFSLYEDLSIEENLDLVAGLFRLPRPARRRSRDTLASLGLTTPPPTSSRARSPAAGSSGWRSPPASCTRPQLLLLDEPTAGVDPKARREFWDEIHRLTEGGMTVLVSTHYMDEAERCHRINYIAYGRLIAEGTVEEVVARAGPAPRGTSPGPGLEAVARRLRATPGVDQVAAFGTSLHVVGTRRGGARRGARRGRGRRGRASRPAETSLEDVFIQFMGASEDNMA